MDLSVRSVLVEVSVVATLRRRVLLDMLRAGGDLLLKYVVALQRRPIGLGCEVECASVT